MTVAEEVRQMRRALGQELARLRQAAGFTQRQFAPLTAYSRSTLSDAELGRSRVGRDFWERCQAVLQAGDTLTRRYDETEAVAAAHQAAAVHDARSARGPLSEVPVTVQVCPVCHQPVKVILLAGNPGRRLPASPPGGDSAGHGNHDKTPRTGRRRSHLFRRRMRSGSCDRPVGMCSRPGYVNLTAA